MNYERTVKCPICGKPYVFYPYYSGDQSACPKCREEARQNKPDYKMGKIEEVKKILAKFGFYIEDKVAQQICQLFPKTEDNPDGYERRIGMMKKRVFGWLIKKLDWFDDKIIRHRFYWFCVFIGKNYPSDGNSKDTPGCSEPKPAQNVLVAKGNEHPEERIPLYKPKASESRLLTIKEAELKRLKEDHQIELQMQSDDLNDRYRIRVEEIIRDLKAILRDADDLRTLERALGDYVQALIKTSRE